MTPVPRLYNTLTRSKDAFVPIDPKNVRLYACGPTVYDYAHIGNARPIIVFDLLFRLLRHVYGAEHVRYVRNVTDVDDKINARAAERGISIRELTDGTLRQFHEDIRALGVLMPEDVNLPGEPPRFVEPRATDHIEEMKAIIERLIAAGHAYVAEEHVLFHVPSMPDYGRFSKRPLDELEAGARVDVAPYKRSPLDFVLWKPSGPADPAWPSPAGIAAPGRPGWHIECSAMAWKNLGETFDIHGGGIDLVFPHHENEIAQSRCCFGTPVMANVWMHNGFLQVEGDKMSKSLGNFTTIHDLLKDWPGEVLRFNMLRTHYRQPLDWTVRGLEESEKVLDRWYEALADVPADAPEAKDLDQEFLDALSDDLNTPRAIARLHSLNAEIRGPAAGRLQIQLKRKLRAAAGLMGLLQESRETWLERTKSRLSVAEERIYELIAERGAARAAKNWAESDRIRGELAGLGVVLKDNKDGTTTWEVGR